MVEHHSNEIIIRRVVYFDENILACEPNSTIIPPFPCEPSPTFVLLALPLPRLHMRLGYRWSVRRHPLPPRLVFSPLWETRDMRIVVMGLGIEIE